MPRLTQLYLAAASRHNIKEITVNRHYRYVMARPGTIQAQIANLPGRSRPPVIVQPIKEWKIHLGDLVIYNCYKYVGKMEGYRGTMVASETPLDYFSVALVDPSDSQPTDIQFRYTEAGDRVRVSKRTGRIIPIPAKALLNPDEPDPAKYTDQPKDTSVDDVGKKTFKIQYKSVEQDLMDKYNIVETRTRAKTYWY
ncbi:39S ribosomal protein L24, mitochondrial-like [Anneissia japonica]|uniref:39S ribosomal protein L24, mitochondrial-like n=1 Tax=Anneissia japonica TaxID=1529436 RepID=UPI0014259B5F|nr:39S ribosomal protein L24, mitochondrial-like [Anneissia japonica]